MADEALLALLKERKLGVLVTLKRDGRPQLSNVLYAYDPDDRVIRVSVTSTRAKSRNLVRDPRASFHVTSDDGWAWTVAEGTAEVTPVVADPYDPVAEELVRLYKDVQGEHPDWEEFRAAQLAEGRQVVRIPVEHAYGQPLR
ncbi:PPOX class F420-dependent oxidoreductase [Streptomyces daliensis]|uniref:PPOX class F420-dependent oxidoreductase n=1 Tax=Streptomyces daliensis TaxID=299421 RepID=A0A8T4IS76_9ACTN|nr:PPOX class F420-dependent oxidoreductase [Streptomyces daliensis]